MDIIDEHEKNQKPDDVPPVYDWITKFYGKDSNNLAAFEDYINIEDNQNDDVWVPWFNPATVSAHPPIS